MLLLRFPPSLLRAANKQERLSLLDTVLMFKVVFAQPYILGCSMCVLTVCVQDRRMLLLCPAVMYSGLTAAYVFAVYPAHIGPTWV
jgi:hypothetical protein